MAISQRATSLSLWVVLSSVLLHGAILGLPLPHPPTAPEAAPVEDGMDEDAIALPTTLLPTSTLPSEATPTSTQSTPAAPPANPPPPSESSSPDPFASLPPESPPEPLYVSEQQLPEQQPMGNPNETNEPEPEGNELPSGDTGNPGGSENDSYVVLDNGIVQLSEQFPHFSGAVGGCFGLSQCNRVENAGSFHQVADGLIANMRSAGYELSELNAVATPGHRVFSVTPPDNGGSQFYLNVYSDGIGSAVYLMTDTVLTLSELRELAV